MEIQDRVKISSLLSEYGALLTEKQRKMLSDYIELDMSLFEVAEQYGITRQAVLDAIKHAVSSLTNFEEKIGKIALKEKLSDALSAAVGEDEALAAKLKTVFEILEG